MNDSQIPLRTVNTMSLPNKEARILIVDDDPFIRHLLKRQAEKLVEHVYLAENGVQGLEIWKKLKPCVVITDLWMPEMDGLEMSQAIIAEDPNAQIIVVTSDESIHDLRTALALGVERYILKPVDAHLFADAILKCIRDRQHLDELALMRQVADLSEQLKAELLEKEQTEIALQKEKQEQKVLIDRLEEAHNQLLQSEKMAAIGQLAAGVAHEINNPIGFVSSNLTVLEQYTTNLLELVQLFAEYQVELPAEVAMAIDAKKKEIDLEYLQGDVIDLLKESQDGLQRVKKIVLDLKDFSHVNSVEIELTDLHARIESTLNVVWNEIKYKASVKKEFGQIPEVECNPSQINQVLMNLLINAAQAIPEHGEITIRTSQQAENVVIEVCDNGVGIPQALVNKIFDPFFTTKPVGVGTGLGLSISAGIILKHHGRISVESEPGKGTCFRICLPVRQPASGEGTP